MEGLSDINVFFGLNDVGKSNIFEALALWRRFLAASQSPRSEQLVENFMRDFGVHLFSLGETAELGVDVDFVIDSSDLARDRLERHIADTVDTRMKHLGQTTIQMTSQVRVVLQSNQVVTSSTAHWEDGSKIGLHPKDLATVVPSVHVIAAERRFQAEARNRETLTGTIHHGNLKKALFYAYLSADVQQKKRFAAIKSVLAEPPFSLGELDVALDQATDQIDIGFIRPQSRLPLDNLGSGSRQLLLVLGQVFLNDFPVVALEEPEMNLSPQWQQDLMVALRRLMQDPAIGLKQIFISTHSPYFEFSENFYDVTLDDNSHTQVKRTTVQDWSAHFAVAPLGPETGARLNSLNQVRLYERLIEDLDLRRGDMIVFVRNDTGRWELRKAEEIAQELQSITASNGKP
ncbi:MAG: AAA family ATPase [Anaerolineae bacterium]